MTIREATEKIETMLVSRADYHPFPKYGEAGWDKLPQALQLMKDKPQDLIKPVVRL